MSLTFMLVCIIFRAGKMRHFLLSSRDSTKVLLAYIKSLSVRYCEIIILKDNDKRMHNTNFNTVQICDRNHFFFSNFFPILLPTTKFT